MPDWSRREALSVLTTGVATALAGCQHSPPDVSRPPAIGSVENYEVARVRNADRAVLLTRSDDIKSGRPGAYEHLTSREDVAAFTFADVPEARTLRQFVDATDFESESIYLLVHTVPECYDHRLVGVGVDGNGPEASFCRKLRPADVECDADAEDTVGYAIRLPFPGDEMSGMGSSGGSCEPSPRPEAFDANVTLANGSEGA